MKFRTSRPCFGSQAWLQLKSALKYPSRSRSLDRLVPLKQPQMCQAPKRPMLPVLCLKRTPKIRGSGREMRAWISPCLLSLAILASNQVDATQERLPPDPEHAPRTSANETPAITREATEPLPVVGINDSLRIPPDEIPVLTRKAKRQDPEAALKLASYYGFCLNDKRRQLYYYKLAAENGSLVAIENLVTIYSRTDVDSFDFEKALRWRRRLKEVARKKGIEIESDAEWAYGLYLDKQFTLAIQRAWRAVLSKNPPPQSEEEFAMVLDGVSADFFVKMPDGKSRLIGNNPSRLLSEPSHSGVGGFSRLKAIVWPPPRR
jgi:hypothetical protein